MILIGPLQRTPTISMPGTRKGRALFDLSNYTEAIDAYDHALEVESNLP